MKQLSNTYALALVFNFCCAGCWGQTQSLAVAPHTFTLGGQTYQGYATEFRQPYAAVKKAWWKYMKNRALILNEQTHYVLTIPAKKKAGNPELKFISKLLEDDKQRVTRLCVTLITPSLQNAAEVERQLPYLLDDFKIAYFTHRAQKQLDGIEAQEKALSRDMENLYLANDKMKAAQEKGSDKAELYQDLIQANAREIARLSRKLFTTEYQRSQLKRDLVRTLSH